MRKIKIVCDGSYSKRLNYASVGCSFEYHNIKYNFSKMVNFERYKENLDILDSNFIEMYSVFFAMENLLKLNLSKEPIEIINDSQVSVAIINKCIEKSKKNIPIRYINNDISMFLTQMIELYLKFNKLVVIFSKRSYTKDAHFLCRREADLKFIKVEYLPNNTFRAMNIKKGTTYLVDIEKPTCTCRYFYYENKSQSCNLKLCKHIVAVKDFIRRAIKDEYVIELSK
ncbi:ribonuclease H family protein [Clostridium saccharoperbutylacetonicum]|uniref:ribonuclease H family protein n=1 Tax=Clostridium saccharoperbutylacetonicum TaxID=36745 RepID=UPI000983B9C2|nr:ribonuclease H family protein [Clostridium saccharoperbutylacetonicum]AQR93410.1 hypothetical protein CLSAP_07080 [Clostridium saccharoperbutylacetonicum]NSB29107.1 ribonuclease HI [Clostridium saccharoperbutylacetonicum]